MTTRVERVRIRGYAWGGNRRPTATRAIGTIAPVLAIALLAAGITLARTTPPRTVTVPADAVTGGAPNGTPVDLKTAAAGLLEATTAKGGTGYRFEIVQRSTITARPGGPLVVIPDPVDPYRSLGTADRYYLAGLTESGYVTPAGFAMELRSGPATAEAAADVAAGELRFRALVSGGVTYRDDGEGWYETRQPPGIGLDPATAALLPRLLRNAAGAKATEVAAAVGELGRADPVAVRALAATTTVADIPGVLAVDGASFTELTKPIGLTFDAAGRLAGILVTARNTNMAEYDLMVVTEITLHYDTVPKALPAPQPAYVAPATVDAP
jgi:hypothetical protein